MRARAWTAALALGLLAGCASPQWTYSRPGGTPARLDQDLEHCRREAHRPYWFAFTRAGRMDQEVLKQCMERRGYTARPLSGGPRHGPPHPPHARHAPAEPGRSSAT